MRSSIITTLHAKRSGIYGEEGVIVNVLSKTYHELLNTAIRFTKKKTYSGPIISKILYLPVLPAPRQ
jgi:hypothetical protein